MKPGSNLDEVAALGDSVDMILVMTVEPGFGGQAFLDDMLPKIRRARELASRSDGDVWVQVDGGIGAETIERCAEAGANVFVAGSAVFRSDRPPGNDREPARGSRATSRVSNWNAVMAEAIDLAQHPGAPRGENPRVGCVIVDADGDVVGRGWHGGAGTDHAEVVALGDAGTRARGGTAVVSLEPCRHTGRTPPCTGALIDAGVVRVVFAQSDPTSTAGGGADVLREAGVDVVSGVLEQQAREVNREWTVAVQRGYPYVTAKCAVSLDGRVAGAEGRRVQLTGSVPTCTPTLCGRGWARSSWVREPFWPTIRS